MGPKILTVDDSQAIRAAVARIFEGFICEVLEAADGAAGLADAEKHRPDLILLDLGMPVMDGFEVLVELKAQPKLRSIPVIVLTAEANPINLLRLAKLGVRDYLEKPVDESLLVERARRLINLQPANPASPKGGRLKTLAAPDA